MKIKGYNNEKHVLENQNSINVLYHICFMAMRMCNSTLMYIVLENENDAITQNYACGPHG